MRNITNFKTIFRSAAVIAIIVAVTVITADGAAVKKSTHEQKIEKIMVDYVEAIQAAKNSYEKKAAPLIRSARTIRDGAIAKVGQAIQAKLERAAKDSKRLGHPDEAKLAEEEIAEFQKLTRLAQTTDPCKPEVKDTIGESSVDTGPLPSHVVFQGHAYMAIMGEYMLPEAMAICEKIGGRPASIESAEELVFIQKALPVRYTLWVGAIDAKHRGQWRWLTGTAVNRACWSTGYPKKFGYDSGKKCWYSVYAAITTNGLISRDGNNRCRGFICEWGR